MKIGAIITAGGKGKRMNSDIAKQYLDLCGKPIIIHSINLILKIEQVKELIVVVPVSDIDYMQQLLQEHDLDKDAKCIVSGGNRRQDSVQNGFELVGKDMDFVLIHDAVRPCLKKDVSVRLIDSLHEDDCAILGVKVKSTLKRVDENNFVKETLDRSLIYEIQTPQVFKKEILDECYSKDNEFDEVDYTDEAMLVEKFGYKVKVVNGDYGNVKITTKEDLQYVCRLKGKV